MATRIVKVGGSLFDLPDLSNRLRTWLDTHPATHNILVTGGGDLVEQIRTWHTHQPIDEISAHWLCIDLMDITARLLHSRMPDFPLCADIHVLEKRCAQPGTTIFRAARWLRDIEPGLSGSKLPVSWQTTSDAIAGRLAIAMEADELVLLKSTMPTKGKGDLKSLAETGLIDPVLQHIGPELPPLRLVNLRE